MMEGVRVLREWPVWLGIQEPKEIREISRP